MTKLRTNNLLRAITLLAFALGSPNLNPRGSAEATAASSDDVDIPALLDVIGEGTAVERLRRVTNGRAVWPTAAQAREQFEILRASSEFAPARDLPHAESGKEVDRIRRVLAPLFELHGGSTIIISVLYTPRPIQGIARGSVYLISSGLLRVLDDGALLALSGHELGHQYFRRDFARAEDAGDCRALRLIELKCDAIAVLSLLILDGKPDALVRGLEWAQGPAYAIGSADTRTHPALDARKRLIARLAI